MKHTHFASLRGTAFARLRSASRLLTCAFLLLPALLHAQRWTLKDDWRETSNDHVVNLFLNPEIYPGNRCLYMHVGQTIIFERRYPPRDNNSNFRTCPYIHNERGVTCEDLFRSSFYTADDNAQPVNYPGSPLPYAPYNGPFGSGGFANEFVRFQQFPQQDGGGNLYAIQALKTGMVVWCNQYANFTSDVAWVDRNTDKWLVMIRNFWRTICIVPDDQLFPDHYIDNHGDAYPAQGVFYRSHLPVYSPDDFPFSSVEDTHHNNILIMGQPVVPF
jgi:hypothetical protein